MPPACPLKGAVALQQSSFFEVRHISKAFPGVKALDDVGFSVERGEVRGLVGENGAGKSTLMKILNGNYKKDAGQILIDGQEVEITDPKKAAEYGISIIFQELNLVDQLSVAENIFAGRLSEGRRLINWKEINNKAAALLKRIGFDVDPRTEVGNLTVAGKQMVEIAKALSQDARIILMDEPSAMLTKKELDTMFQIIRDLKAEGMTVIYISHRMEEIFEICDTATVMRDGKIIGTRKVSEVQETELVEMMVGREVSSAFPVRHAQIGEEVLRVENLCRRDREQNVSFSLHKGEVLGVAGLVGAGRTEVMRAVFGADYIKSCDVYIRGQKVSITDPASAKRHGIAFLTEDRKAEGLILDFTIRANLTMANLPKIKEGGFTSGRLENAIADEYIDKLSIKTPSRNQKVGNLSGGNQQKIVVGKWLNADPEILIMDEPTRGIDVGAKHEIYEMINDLAESGKAIIMISSELPEVLGMCDRVLVMKDDRITGELTGSGINAVSVMKYAL